MCVCVLQKTTAPRVLWGACFDRALLRCHSPALNEAIHVSLIKRSEKRLAWREAGPGGQPDVGILDGEGPECYLGHLLETCVQCRDPVLGWAGDLVAVSQPPPLGSHLLCSVGCVHQASAGVCPQDPGNWSLGQGGQK